MRSPLARVGPYAGVAVAIAVIAGVWSWPLALNATTHTAIQANAWDDPARLALLTHDQMYSISGTARNAAALLRGDPRALIDQALCHPVPMSATLGEHMIELGLLGLPGYAVSGNPILAYNTACLLLLMIAGVGAFAVVRHWTGSSGAGFAAALLFAFYPSRIDNLVHPPVIGTHWMPWVLLAFERLIETGRVRYALGLGAAASLQAWVGAYPLMVLAFFAAPYGAVRLGQLRARLDTRRLALLSLAVALAGGAAALALVPYALAGDVWGVLRERAIYLVWAPDLLPGGSLSLGIMAFLLAAPLVFLRTGRGGPAPALSVAAFVCVALCSRGRYWPGGPELSGLYPWLAELVRPLAAVRVPLEIRYGATLGLSLLAGLGMDRALRRAAPGPMSSWLSVAIAAAILVETFAPGVSDRVYGRAPRVALAAQAPDPERLAAYRALDAAGHAGPVLDLPHRSEGHGAFLHLPRYTLLAGYHLRPVAACFSSYAPASFLAVERMAARLPELRGVEELVASGFRNAVLHHSQRPLPAEARLERGLAALPDVVRVGGSSAATAYRFEREVPTHGDVDRLEAIALRHRPPDAAWRRPRVEIAVVNRADRTFALPHPIRPLEARARWRPRDGGAPGEWFETRFLLPLALAAGAEDAAPIDLGLPPKGCDCVPEVDVPELGWSLR